MFPSVSSSGDTSESDMLQSSQYSYNVGQIFKSNCVAHHCKGIVLINMQSQDGCVRLSQLWLAVSADRRVSVWSADWSRDVCELVDWLTFPAPAFVSEDMSLKPGVKVLMMI